MQWVRVAGALLTSSCPSLWALRSLRSRGSTIPTASTLPQMAADCTGRRRACESTGTGDTCRRCKPLGYPLLCRRKSGQPGRGSCAVSPCPRCFPKVTTKQELCAPSVSGRTKHWRMSARASDGGSAQEQSKRTFACRHERREEAQRQPERTARHHWRHGQRDNRDFVFWLWRVTRTDALYMDQAHLRNDLPTLNRLAARLKVQLVRHGSRVGQHPALQTRLDAATWLPLPTSVTTGRRDTFGHRSQSLIVATPWPFCQSINQSRSGASSTYCPG
jgi:hypothetical protein